MATDLLVEQFIFDYDFAKCLDELNDTDWILTEEINVVLKALMNRSISPVISGNKLKAHLLVIVCNMLELKNLSFEDILDAVGDANTGKEILQLFDNLEASVQYLSESVTFSRLVGICQECLNEIYILLVKILSMAMADETKRSEDYEWMKIALDKLKSLISSLTYTDKNILKQCDEVLSKPGSHLDIEEHNVLWSLVKKLVLEALLLVEAPSKCVCQLECNVYGGWLSESRCSDSDLLEIMEKTTEAHEDERAFKEKCERIRKHRQQNQDISQKQLELSIQRGRHKPDPKSSTPRQALRDIIQEETTTMSDVSPASDSSPVSKILDIYHRYHKLPSVQPKMSLLSFGNSKKPPSHLTGIRGKWLQEEEDRFIVKTLEIGEGKWSKIKTATGSLRSNVQLKDKWRQIPVRRKREVAKFYNLVYSGT